MKLIQCVSKNRTATINITQLQFTTFSRDRPYSIHIKYIKKFLNWLRTSCAVSITTVAN